MPSSYIIFLVVFIIVLAVFAYIGTRGGFVRSLNSFLRIAVPMLLSGIIVKIAQLISHNVDLVSYIIGGIGTVIFFLVLRSVIVDKEENKKLGIINYFLGFVIGLAEGWLVAGFVVIYLNYFNIVKIQAMLSPAFFRSIEIPVKWILFLDFIKF